MPRSGVYKALGSGICATRGKRLPYCQKNNIGQTACKAACDQDEKCTGYNPNTYGTWCFLFHTAGSPLTDKSWTTCYYQKQAGTMDGHDGTEGGTCYQKLAGLHWLTAF